MTTTATPDLLPTLESYINAARKKYKGCIAHVAHNLTVDGVDATIRLHYVRCDGNGQPKFNALAEVLADHITSYCIEAQKRKKATTEDERNRLFREAGRLFRQYGTSGEPGELLLYFLLEAVLGAPQALCKMSLKTNRNDEIKGSDGVHIRWDKDKGILIVYFAEAKLYAEFSAGLTDAFQSIVRFHEEGALGHEIFLVTNHFNLLNDSLKEQVCDCLDNHTPGTYRMVHACLVGFDWEQYCCLDDDRRKAFLAEFEQRYLKRAQHIKEGLDKRFKDFPHKHIDFEFFFMPFRSVQQFRDWFFQQLPGG